MKKIYMPLYISHRWIRFFVGNIFFMGLLASSPAFLAQNAIGIITPTRYESAILPVNENEIKQNRIDALADQFRRSKTAVAKNIAEIEKSEHKTLIRRKRAKTLQI